MGEIGSLRLDDTPVNGQTERGITSNWAYDEDAALRALVESVLPWTIYINVFHTAKSHVNWNTFFTTVSQIFSGFMMSSNAQNDEITFDVVLHAGTWEIELFYIKSSDAGIFSVQLDSVEKGTIDSYAAAPAYNQRSSITGIVISTTAEHELKLKMATKHASSSAYYGYITSIRFLRTA